MSDKGQQQGARRLIIHCGVQKTASTSLHHFVARNRAALADRVEVLTPVKGSPMRDLGRLAMAYSLDPDQRDAFEAAALRVRDIVRAGDGPMILSHENLCGAMPGKGGVTTLYPQLEAIIEVLDRVFAEFAPTYVFYTRDMSAWKNSVYGQAVRSDNYAKTRAAFLADTEAVQDWDGLAQRMTRLVGAARCRFLALEDEADPIRPGQQLLNLAGVSVADHGALSPMVGRSNTGLNTGAMEFLRLINGLGLNRPDRRRLAELISSHQSLFVSG